MLHLGCVRARVHDRQERPLRFLGEQLAQLLLVSLVLDRELTLATLIEQRGDHTNSARRVEDVHRGVPEVRRDLHRRVLPARGRSADQQR
jgi:hypothetical protein